MVTRAKKKAQAVEAGAFDLADLGIGSDFVLAEDYTMADVDNWIPTGIPAFDETLVGGLPMGRIVEIYSQNNVGKTTLVIQVNRMANKMGIPVFWFDVEGTNNRSHLQEMGVDMKKSIYYQPKMKTGKETSIESIAAQMELVLEQLQAAGKKAVIVFDSVGASMSTTTLDGDYDLRQPGIEAKAWTKVLAKLTPLTTATGSMLILINQVRDKMGAMAFGEQTETPGGKALKHYASYRINLKNVGQNKLNGEHFGHKTRLILTKSKLGEPKLQSDSLLFGRYGFNEYVNALYEGVAEKIIESKVGGPKKSKYFRIGATEDGEPVDIYEKDLPELIEAGELETTYLEYFQDIFAKLVDKRFPNGYPALQNKDFNIADNPIMAKVKMPDVESEEPTEEPTEESEEVTQDAE